MSEHQLELRAAAYDFGDEVMFALVARGPDGIRAAIAKPVVMEPFEPGMPIEPMCRISAVAARKLMDELWSIGIRPTEFKHTDAAMKAADAHLQDMRAIAFARLEIERP